MKDRIKVFLIVLGFFVCYFLPLDRLPFEGPLFESLALTRWYAREHVFFCLIPAFFIAGAIAVFIGKDSVIRYFGAQAHKCLAYGVASISGAILAVCSCTVLPLFSGIYRRGAGLGPATAFLYSGPAINVLAIIMTARILGWQLGLARAVGAVLFSIVIGLLMHLIFLKEERSRKEEGDVLLGNNARERGLWKNALYFGVMVGFLIAANWAKPAPGDGGIWAVIYRIKWPLSLGFLVLLSAVLLRWFRREELSVWTGASLRFAQQILPLLLIGVLTAGFLLGRPGHEGIIPSRIVERALGGNSLSANFFASIFGAFMYFATLTEIPILQGLLGAGMGKGPALALLLAGPALSLPNMLVIRSVIGTRKTVVYVGIVMVMAALSGILFGSFFL
ncbi:MAG: permease [Candidatus Omnitrophica bacterium]|nr:permease [Candidatus Omnitrophota bacterium]